MPELPLHAVPALRRRHEGRPLHPPRLGALRAAAARSARQREVGSNCIEDEGCDGDTVLTMMMFMTIRDIDK